MARSRRAARSARSGRVPRCCYNENGRQCVRNGTGEPPLCRAHRLVLQDLYERDEAASGLGQVISDFMGGRSIRPDDVLRAAFEMFGAMGAGGMGARAGAGVPGGARVPWGMGGTGPVGGVPPIGQRRVRPPPDPAALELQRSLLMARQELGFEPRAPLTVAEVERRRKDLARKHHPDLGGSVARMSAINQAADLLVAKGQLG